MEELFIKIPNTEESEEMKNTTGELFMRIPNAEEFEEIKNDLEKINKNIKKFLNSKSEKDKRTKVCIQENYNYLLNMIPKESIKNSDYYWEASIEGKEKIVLRFLAAEDLVSSGFRIMGVLCIGDNGWFQNVDGSNYSQLPEHILKFTVDTNNKTMFATNDYYGCDFGYKKNHKLNFQLKELSKQELVFEKKMLTLDDYIGIMHLKFFVDYNF